MRRIFTLIRVAACTAVVLAAGARRADAAKCEVAVTTIVFGSYDVFVNPPLDSTGTIVYRCNGGARNVQITISRGSSGTYSPREMLSFSPDRLRYNLYRDASRTTVWGDSTGGTSSYFDSDPPNNRDIEVRIYGRVTAGQDVSAGVYGDAVTVTVNY